jgi:hypothetical protein
MSAKTIATASVCGLIVLWLGGTSSWNAWKVHRMEQIAIGADKAAVLAALGDPDDSPTGHLFAACFEKSAKECWTWELFGQNYIDVWFDASGRVVCRASFAVWT